MLTWGAQPGNNPVLRWYGPDLQSFDEACRQMMCSFNVPLPEGSLKARIRCTSREMKKFKGASLGDTLGDEPAGLVQIDFQGHPIRYDELAVYEEVVAESRSNCKLDLQVQTEGGNQWQSVGALELPPGQHSWREKLKSGARRLREDTRVKVNDAHYDAKLFPHVHPYGTGSLLSEVGSGAPQKHCRARALALQSWFRQSSLWCFWQLDLSIKRALFFKNATRHRLGRSPDASGSNFGKHFGTVVPSTIPDSTAWWRRQAKELNCICDDAEAGLMQAMVTITHNNRSAEMLATVRRGPLARPTALEQIEYLFTRVPTKESRKDFEKFPLEHVLSFQRRVLACKKNFLARGKRTPLGIVQDYWDRTEAQQRGSLHAHILTWFKPRRPPSHWTRLPPVDKRTPGVDGKQRPFDQCVPVLQTYQEDSLYQMAEIARVSGEMPRADVSSGDIKFGGYDYETLRVAGLARSVLIRLGYLHVCSPNYCLLNRSCCRFFFPWPMQPHQVYDDNTQRIALQRRFREDDQWVVPHNLYFAMFPTSTVNVIGFDPTRNVDQARGYASKCCAKIKTNVVSPLYCKS